MAFCLPKFAADKFRAALIEGKIDPAKMADMPDSATRREFLREFVGDDAPAVNALFESKLLLKDQQRGLITWAKKVSGITKETRQDLISKIERMTTPLDAATKESFLADLAAKKLGTEVSHEEIQHIVKLTKESRAAEEKIPEGADENDIDAFAYGLKRVELQNYVRSLKGRNESLIRDIKEDPIGGLFKAGYEGMSVFKSLLSTADNSFFGRQGAKVMYRNPIVWGDGFAKSWADIGREIIRRKSDVSPMDLIRARVYAMPEARSGEFERLGIDIGLNSEEAFPSEAPGKIPVLGRAFNAAETAFNGGALRLRAELGRIMIRNLKKAGFDTMSKSEISGLGELVNSMTGRGKIDFLSEKGAKGINVMLFSVKFLKSNFDTLTGHRLGYAFEKGPKRNFARKEAAKNLLAITVGVATVLAIADVLHPGSVEWDPRSSKFGKIKIGNVYHDVTGGMGSIVTLAARLVPTEHNGKWGFWSKSATTGAWADLTSGKYGASTALDTFENFWEGKAAPVPGVLRDVWAGKNFQGDKPTVKNEGVGLVTPLPVQAAQSIGKVEDAGSAPYVASLILEGLGFSSSQYQKKK